MPIRKVSGGCPTRQVMSLHDRFVDWANAHPFRWLGWYVVWMLLVIFAFAANAGTADLTWTQPTQNVDGSAIPASGTGRLTGNRVEWGSCTGTAPNYGFGVQAGQQVFTTPTAVYTVPNLAPGTWCFRAYASTTYGESGPSGVAAKVIAPPLPNPPSGLTAAGGMVYHIQKRENRFVMLPVGTVPAGTVCDTTQSVNGYYVVPRDSVAWSGTVKPPVVVSPCS